MSAQRYRLVTRSDFDGLVCGMLLKELDLVDEITFVHPKDMQDGKVAITDRDITTNLPYRSECHLAFDHHSSEMLRNNGTAKNHVIDPKAPSAARVVYDYYGGAERFPMIRQDLMDAVDKGDSAQFSRDEILDPTGWVLLNFLMDSRTGLGRFRQFRISNYELMMQLIDYCREHSVEEILALPDVAERVDLFREQQEKFVDQLMRCCEAHGPVVVLDLRNEEIIYSGNRFMVYALFPECNISMHVMWGLKQQNTVFAIGKSILDRSSPVDVGALCLAYGGGGHHAAGTCQVDNDRADEVKAKLIETVKAGGGAATAEERLSA
ncbi:exopolyphosphatase [Jiella marina]|uniref:exopolyphosphatase n=1 Tax=Jiella sp. LLJ827 TaxID=2917712 RepID=UPI00210119B7|nr:exopolyphosphatase [Jiella sp. LLJ827]MCQ0987629.1 exopolyphosphatase [Jiella sp. LLJ827]